MTVDCGDLDAGKVLTLTLNMSEAVTVTGTPTLTLNDGGTATYIGGSGTSALTFSYTVGAGQNTAALAVTGVTGTITDLAGNALSTAGLPETLPASSSTPRRRRSAQLQSRRRAATSMPARPSPSPSLPPKR